MWSHSLETVEDENGRMEKTEMKFNFLEFVFYILQLIMIGSSFVVLKIIVIFCSLY